MSKITDRQKLDFLFKRNQNLVSTDLNTNNFNQPIHENRKYVLGSEIYTQIIPNKPLVYDISKSLYDSKYKITLTDLYKEDSALKEDNDSIVLQVNQLKLQKIPNTTNSWYYLDSDGNNFLSYIIPSNYGTKLGDKFPYYEINIYSKNGLDRSNSGNSYLANEKIRSCEYIFDFANGVLILTDNLKDNNNELIDDCNPPFISFYKYIGTTLEDSIGGGGQNGGTGLGGQWTKNDSNNSIYYKDGTVLIGTDKTLDTGNTLNYDLQVDGNVYITKDLHVKGDQIIHDDLHVIDDISANTLNIGGKADISGNLTVEGAKTVVQDISGQDASFNNLSARDIYIENDIYKNGKIINLNPTVNNIKQTFYEVLTQQPSKFNKGIYTKSSTSIVLNWSYVDILANQTSQLIAKLNFQSSVHLRNIPHIDKIYVDISGNSINNSGTWINFTVINVTGDYTADNNSYEIGLVNITNILGSNPGKFDARVYGENFGTNNYPNVETRAIIFNDLQFGESKKPGKPIITNEMSINSEDNFTFQAKVNQTEDGISNSTAVIIESLTQYEIKSSKSSSIIVHNMNYFTNTQNITPNKSNNEVFNITLNSLKPGTQYDYNIKVKNNINIDYSDFSDQKTSNFLRLPGDNGFSTTTLNFSQNSNEQEISVTTPIDTANLNNNQIYYKNIATNATFTFNNTNTQTIQITKPYTVNQQNDTVGYGIYVDDASELVKVECLIDTNQKQVVAFHGFNTTDDDAGTATRSSSSYNFFNSPSQQDIWTTPSRRGFRIKGNFQLNDISDINSNIGAAKSTKYTLEYKYTRKSDVGGASTNTKYDIYIDNLPTDPSINNATTTAEVKSVVYTMGIPSVKTIDIAFSRKYQNINSVHKYLPGNLKIAEVTDIERIKFTTKDVILDRNSILNTGEYDFSFTEDGKYYDEPMGIGNDNDTQLDINEKVYSLRQTAGLAITTNKLSVDHHFDMNSYNNVGSNLISSKLSLNGIYEIASNNISKLGNDVGAIQVTQYTSHETIPKDWTLLYYGGSFRTNASIKYPNVNNYEWDSVITTGSQYSAGTTSYDLNGTVASNNGGYKWIVFKLSMSNKSNTNIAGTITYYYDVYSYLTGKGFSESTLNKIRDPNDNDVVAFVKQNVDSAMRIGNLGRNVKPSDVWYGKTSNVSYHYMANDVSKAAYGCRYPASVSAETSKSWGPMLEINKGDDTIYLFLGLKNSD